MNPTPVSVSVVVVSRDRPAELRRCLLGLTQLDHPAFEIVVVADPAGQAAVAASELAERVKTVAFDRPNISAARNLGIGAAAGAVVAFIDDDAVPEPTWLRHLAAPFGRAERVDAAAGYVRGRNGISFQSRGVMVDRLGRDLPLRIEDTAPRVVTPPPGQAVKTVGTNCAFRREVLLAQGGFDPGFAFYMDETDLDLRLAAVGAPVAVVPLAQVHHGFAASPRRTRARLPTNLFDVGRSSARLLRKHAPGADAAAVLAELEAGQRARLLRHMLAGNCAPRDVGRILATLAAGWADGMAGAPGSTAAALPGGSPPPFLPFRRAAAFGPDLALCGRLLSAPRLRAEAAAAVREGRRTSLYLFSRTALYHRVRFTADGVWEQTGGLYGRSDRSDRMLRIWNLRARVERERNRVALVRETIAGSAP